MRGKSTPSSHLFNFKIKQKCKNVRRRLENVHLMVRLAVVDPNSPTSRTESVVLRNGKLIPATTEDDLSIVLNVAFCDYLFEAVSIMDDINR